MWLLESSVLERLDKALRVSAISGDVALPALQPKTLSVADGGRVAVIEVKGILTKEADPFVALFYGANTAYDDIVSQIAAAERDSKVESVRFDIDSPGGNVDGLFDALAAISAMTKPRSVQARNAMSAAYGIAAAVGNITGSSPSAQFGSVGTAVSMAVRDDVITLTSSGAPEKRPDPTTEEGRASIIRYLDAIDDLFVGAIAEGRGVSSEAVRQNFGRGAVLLAGEAERRGMIDGIAGIGLRVVEQPKATADGGSEECMDLEQLKVEHPAVYKAAVGVGVAQERERVEAHLQLAETGDLKTAIADIKSGADITQKTWAAHMSAAMNRRDVEARQDDEKVVDEATRGIETKKKDDEFETQVTDAFLKLVGNGAIENG